MDRIPVRMIRANNNHVDTVEREKEEHEKQYEEVSEHIRCQICHPYPLGLGKLSSKESSKLTYCTNKKHSNKFNNSYKTRKTM